MCLKFADAHVIDVLHTFITLIAMRRTLWSHGTLAPLCTQSISVHSYLCLCCRQLHSRRNTSCAFIRGDDSRNIPLSVSLAALPFEKNKVESSDQVGVLLLHKYGKVLD
jgi:hypothetical protein